MYDLYSSERGQGTPMPGTSEPCGTRTLTYIETLHNGYVVVVSGNPEGHTQFNHLRGDNRLGYQAACGLVACMDLLNQAGINVDENAVVQIAARTGLCDTSSADPAHDGGTSPQDQVTILSVGGVSAHVEVGNTASTLARQVKDGQGVIIAVNAGVLWNDPSSYQAGQANHAVVVTGVARGLVSGEIDGFYINDSGDGQSGEFVAITTMQQAWQAVGGVVVVTDAALPTNDTLPPWLSQARQA
jgi:hypothetical protein